MPKKFPEKVEIDLNSGEPINQKEMDAKLKALAEIGNAVLFQSVKEQIELFKSGKPSKGAFGK